jgi:prepilin-type N-terminal cleavage/methylation domain-containing protein
MRNLKNAFTLVELMVTIVIVGVLATIAVVSYNKYAQKAKVAEGYVAIDAMTQVQVKNFMERKRFQQAGNPARVPKTKLPILDNVPWTNMGKPLPPGSLTSFKYEARAGKNNGAGDPILLNDYTNGNTLLGNFSSWSLIEDPEGAFCGEVSDVPNQTHTIMDSPLGKPHYNWTLLTATANFKSDGTAIGRHTCTLLTRLIDTDTKGTVRSGPITSRDVGE